MDHTCMGLFLGSVFGSSDLCVCFHVSTMLFWLLWPCRIVWYQVVWYLLLCSSFSRLLSLFGVISKIYKELRKLNTSKKKIQLKSGQKTWIDISSKTTKRCSISLIIREMQVKTTMRYHLIPVRMAITNKYTNTSVGEDVEQRESSCTVGGNADWRIHFGKQYGVSWKY